ncbi:MAG TPA: dihydrofolate reductase family protein [Solirubrobacteraceae bacterium]|jgi:riboflavin-specific deaminase-like protein
MPSSPHDATSEPAPVLRGLLPPSTEVSVERLVDDLDLIERGAESRSRPYLALNMISSTDGRATLGGRSGGLGGRADSLLLHGLRTTVDAVMAGAGTVRAERYSRLVCEERDRKTRRERGLAEEPLVCVVSGRLALSKEIPLLADRDAHVAIITASNASLPQECRAQIEYIRAAREGALDLRAALEELRERFGVRTLLCEGGPHLNSHLLAGGLVDELFLTLSPKLAGGDATSEALGIVSGPELEPPFKLALLAVHEHESYLFLRYRVIPS